MARGPEIQTHRLWLRRWKTSDLKPFAGVNADMEVMQYMPSILTERETAEMIARIEHHFKDHGFGLWAIEHATGHFVGFAGLSVVSFEAPFTPAVEVSWRLAREHWGNGYATEATRAVMRFGFQTADLDEIVFSAVHNDTRSTSVVERLGMSRDPAGDFDHPEEPEGSPLRRHVLFRMPRERWFEIDDVGVSAI